jgi:Mg/Co/Ni transporter MgtE
MSDTDIKAMAESLRSMAGDLTLAWANEEQCGEVHVRISEYVALDMVDRMTKIAEALEAMAEAEQREVR